MANNVLACAACMRRLVYAPLAARALSSTAFVASTRGVDSRRAVSTKAVQAQDFEEIFSGKQLTEEEKETHDREAKEKLAQQFARRKLSKIDDPFHIGQAVMAALREDKFEGALLLTEKASRTMNVVVSWNALIAHQLGKGEVKTALKTFNNMKKRGQLPNVQTFTTIFSGLRNCTNKSLAVAEAVKHYNMLLQDTRLEANIIHTNAVLRLCAMANDLDQMLLIANTLDNKTRAPDATTYTVLLEGIRYKVLAEIKNLDGDENTRYRRQMTDKAMILWSEVIKKWKMGRLMVDERLVVAMARTYPFAEERTTPPEDSKILDLLHNMMDVPNYAKHPDWDLTEAERLKNEALAQKSDPKRASKAVANAKAQRGMLVKPTTRTLALILEVIGASRRSALAIKYWNKLVDHFGVRPDHDNYFRMLVILKHTKSSAHIVWLLQNSPDMPFNAGHFKLALEACINDNINTNAMGNAEEILKIAKKVMGPNHEELMVLYRLYLRVALVSHHNFRQLAKNGKEDAAIAAYGRQIVTALNYLWRPYHELHDQWFNVAPATVISNEAAAKLVKSASKTRSQSNRQPQGSTKMPLSEGQLRNTQREVIALARNMYAAYNKVMVENMLPQKEAETLRIHAASLNREIQRFYSDRAEHEPKLPPKDPGSKDVKRRRRLTGAASVNDFTSSTPTPPRDDDSSGADKKSLEDEADELAQELLPETQDMVGIARVGAEFVWSTRKPLESSAKPKMEHKEGTRGKRRTHSSPPASNRETRASESRRDPARS